MAKFAVPGALQDPLAYTNKRINVVPCVQSNREPLASDNSFPLWTEWRVSENPTTGTEGDFWKLINFTSGNAVWVLIATGSSGPTVTLSDTAGTKVFTDVEGNIQLEGGSGINVTSDAANNKLTFDLSGSGAAIDSFTVPAGTSPVIPDGAGNVDLTVGAGIVLTGGTNSIAHSLDGSVVGQTITGDSGGALSPTSGNWNIIGVGDTSTSGSGSTLSIKEAVSSSFVVDPDSDYGTHTTIQSAITAASAGEVIIIRPGTYTEDLTLKVGVDLVSISTDFNSGQVTIVGKCTLSSGDGVCSISNVRFTTNSDYSIVVSGSDDSYVRIINCVFNVADNTAISYTNSSSSSGIFIDGCLGNISATGITLFECSGSGSVANFGSLYVRNTNIRNSANSSTASTTSSSQVAIYNCRFSFPLSTTSTGTYDVYNSTISNQNGNTTSLTTAGTGTSSFKYCTLTSGTSSALSIGTGTTVNFFGSSASSSNTNAITGAGTLVYTPINFYSASSTVNVTTQTVRSFGPRVQLNGGAQLISGSGSPNTSITAPQGSLYLRTDGSSTSTRAYINTDGSTAWTNITTAT